MSTDAWEPAPTFGFDFLADAVAKVILDSAPQLTLAVYGDWGLGKTTLLHAVRDRIISSDSPVAWFDMWEYKNQMHVIVHLLDAIADALPKASSAARGLRMLARSALASASVSAGAVTLSGRNLLGELDRISAGPKVETEQLQSCIDRWRRTTGAAERRRIVVVVDNLDRCVPESAAGLLEQIASLFGFPGVVFLLAADRDRLARAVETKHGLAEGDGARYLDKIVQVEFRVPSLDEDQVVSWIQTLAEPPLALAEEDARLLAQVAGWNPRTIKRMLNNVRIQLCTSRQDLSEDGGAVLASTLILYHKPAVWLQLTRSADFRKEISDILDRSV